jgi:hypothetical protein
VTDLVVDTEVIGNAPCEVDERKLKRAFYTQRSDAARRGISFELDWPTWRAIWISSGHAHERGRGASAYCMARFGDKGPYNADNIKIITNFENSSEGSRGRSPESLARMAAALRGNTHTKGKRMPPPTPEHRAAVSAGLKLFHERQRAAGIKVVHSPERRAQASARMMGNAYKKGKPQPPMTPEQREKFALTIAGKRADGTNKRGPLSPEHRAKIGAASRGRPRSPEAIAKTAAAQRGRRGIPWTEDLRERIMRSRALTQARKRAAREASAAASQEPVSP